MSGRFSFIEMRDLKCMGDLQSALIEAFRSQDLVKFTQLLGRGADAEIEDIKTKISVFEYLCKTPGSSIFIEECLKFNCDPNRPNSFSKKQPIHFIIESGDVTNLEAFLNNEKSGLIDVNAQYSGVTPLLQLAQTITDTNFNQTAALLKLLLENDADPNIADHRELTPILAILEAENLSSDNKERVIRFMLSNNFIDLDSFRDGEAREIIAADFPTISLPEILKIEDRHWDARTLGHALMNEDEPLFQVGLKQLMLRQVDADNRTNVLREAALDNNETLLQLAIRYGLTGCVRTLLDVGADVNYHCSSSKSPAELACFYGYWKILKIFLDSDKINLDTSNREPLLCIVVRRIGEEQFRNSCDYEKCFDMLLNSNKINPNQLNKDGSSALHCAVKYKNERAITTLLQKGCYIGQKNRFNEYAVMDINRRVLERHLDNCIQPNNARPGDEDYEIEYNYMNFVPLQARQSFSHNNDVLTCQEEMGPIEYLATSPDLRRLLQHPLIASFLFLKWHRLSLVFYMNFLAYSFFCIILSSYVLVCYGREVDPMIAICLQTFTILGISYVGLRELFQMAISPRTYFTQLENWMELTLIALTFVILIYEEFLGTTRQTIAAITILLATGEFFLLLGSLPVLSFSTHLVMLKTVAKSFLRSLLLYSVILIAFGLSFYTLLGSSGNVATAGNGTEDAENADQFNTFVSPGVSLIKTVVMLTGEFDAGSINFELNAFSYILFLVFIFLISSVLFNLLNGLAVSDTQIIKSEAELLHFIHRAKLLSRYERTMFGQNRDGCCNVVFKQWASKAISMFPKVLPVHTVLVRPNDANSILVPKESKTPSINNGFGRKSFDYNLLYKTAKTSVPHVLGSDHLFCCITGDSCSRMDPKIVKYTRAVLDGRDEKLAEELEQKEAVNRMNKMEKTMKVMDSRLQLILEKLNRIEIGALGEASKKPMPSL